MTNDSCSFRISHDVGEHLEEFFIRLGIQTLLPRLKRLGLVKSTLDNNNLKLLRVFHSFRNSDPVGTAEAFRARQKGFGIVDPFATAETF